MRPSCLDGAVRRGRQRPRPKLRQARPALGLLGPSGSRAHATGPEGRSAPLARSPPASPSRAPGPLLHAHRLGLYASARHRVVASPRCGRARVEAVHLRWRARAAPSPELRARVGATPAPESRSCALVGAVPASGPRRRAGVASSPGLRARVGAARAPLEAVPRTSPGAAHGLPACAAGACPHASWGATPVSSGLEGPRPSHGEPWACAHRPPPPGVRFLTLTACSYDLAEMGRDGPFSFCWTAWAICTN
jgi:hypothetical protein